jgi:hypothetical protein
MVPGFNSSDLESMLFEFGRQKSELEAFAKAAEQRAAADKDAIEIRTIRMSQMLSIFEKLYAEYFAEREDGTRYVDQIILKINETKEKLKDPKLDPFARKILKENLKMYKDERNKARVILGYVINYKLPAEEAMLKAKEEEYKKKMSEVEQLRKLIKTYSKKIDPILPYVV